MGLGEKGFGQETLYLRKSSGLVRVGGPWSAFAFNFIFTGNSIGIVAAFILYSYAFVSPGMDAWLLILAATVLSIFIPATYALFGIIMPRSGGDYHYIGRTLHPSLGFMSSWSWAIWLALVIGWAGSVVVPIALSSIFAAWGLLTDNQGLISLATTITEPIYVYVIAAFIIVLFAVIQLVGTKVYFTIQNIAFVLMVITLIITFGVYLTITPTVFASRVDALFGAGSYSNLVQEFKNTVQLPSFTVGHALSGIVLWAGIATWSMGTSIIAGEIKDVKRSMLIGHLVGILALGITFALSAFLFYRAFGTDFIYAASYLEGTDAYTLGIPPFYNAFVSILLDNPIIFVLFSIGFFLGGMWFMPQNIMLASRNMLAWSFDRLFPEALGKVDSRFRTPWVAIIIVTIIALISLWIYTFTNWLGLFSQLFAIAFSFLLTGIAAIVFPFVKKEMFEASPVRWKIGPIPVISLVGLGNVIFMLVFMYRNAVDANLGSNHPFSLALIAGTFAVGFILFWIIRYIRKRQGIDLDILYKELPPE